jgi:transposase
MNITTIGLDLAKSVFQLQCIDSSGKVIIKKQIKHAQIAEYFVSLKSC